MKCIFFIIILYNSHIAYSMGAPRNVYINDMVETTATLNQVAPDQGHEDQQMLEEKEKKAEQEDTKEAKEPKPNLQKKLRRFHE